MLRRMNRVTGETARHCHGNRNRPAVPRLRGDTGKAQLTKFRLCTDGLRQNVQRHGPSLMYSAEFVESAAPCSARNFDGVHCQCRSMWHAGNCVSVSGRLRSVRLPTWEIIRSHWENIRTHVRRGRRQIDGAASAAGREDAHAIAVREQEHVAGADAERPRMAVSPLAQSAS